MPPGNFKYLNPTMYTTTSYKMIILGIIIIAVIILFYVYKKYKKNESRNIQE